MFEQFLILYEFFGCCKSIAINKQWSMFKFFLFCFDFAPKPLVHCFCAILNHIDQKPLMSCAQANAVPNKTNTFVPPSTHFILEKAFSRSFSIYWITLVSIKFRYLGLKCHKFCIQDKQWLDKWVCTVFEVTLCKSWKCTLSL